jgi:bifunctional non-homologous end joining protein LigD
MSAMKYKPMLAIIGPHDLLDDKKLIFEPKLDGYRALCQISPDKTELFSRRGINITQQFPELRLHEKISKAKSCIIDGEIIVYNKRGVPDYNMLLGRSQLTQPDLIAEKSKKHPATYAVFDILSVNGKSVMKWPLIKRQQLLHKTIIPDPNIELVPSTHEGQKLWREMKRKRMEGVMVKDPQGIYSPGKRTRAWQKVKFLKSLECIILGFTSEKKAISSLALGLYDADNKLHYIGRVGTGFSQEKIDELLPKLKPIITAKAPAPDIPEQNLTYVKPKVVCEVKYLEMSPYGILRTTAYLHMRDDKKARECTFAQIGRN